MVTRSLLRRVTGPSLRDRVRNMTMQRELGLELLLLRIRRNQMRWFRHLIRTPPGYLTVEVFLAS